MAESRASEFVFQARQEPVQEEDPTAEKLDFWPDFPIIFLLTSPVFASKPFPSRRALFPDRLSCRAEYNTCITGLDKVTMAIFVLILAAADGIFHKS
ncbi:MAG TPA: hypothetical protein ENI68_11460 [Gammaproteobacteria bacterium]|nr:hypothetical protein [Gammaproteobacteria bacterium]